MKNEINAYMRLKKEHIDAIKKCSAGLFGDNARVYLFGSRVSDNKKGGDIDLYIETNETNEIFNKKIKLIVELKKIIGDRKIDVVINNFKYDKDIYKVARSEGVRL